MRPPLREVCKAEAVSVNQSSGGTEKPISGESGDGWVVRDDGSRYWGLFGAAGLVAFDPERGILLQHRVEWSHHGGTWGIPGGARHQLETAVDAALREAAEEAAVPVDSVEVLFEHQFELGFWSYTTVVGIVTKRFNAVVTDAESNELRWVRIRDIDSLELHPGFASSWPEIRHKLEAAISQWDAQR